MLNEASFFSKAIDASGGAQVDYSEVIDLAHGAGYSLHFTITRTAAVLGGNIINQKSNDGIMWIDLTTTAIADSAVQYGAFEVVDAFYRYARIKVATASGKATVGMSLTTKGF